MSHVISSGPSLRIARDTRQFLNVDAREAVFLNDALGDQDRVFEVVAVPRHERDAHVLTQRELAHVDRRTVGEDVAARDHIAFLHERTLVDAGVLVRTRELRQVVDIDAGFARIGFTVGNTHDDTRRIDAVDDAAAQRDHAHARVARDVALHTGADQRLLGADRRHALTLHVRTHQRAVRVVVFEERNQRRRDRNDLLRRNVHVVDVFRRRLLEFVLVPHVDEVADELTFRIELRTRLRDHVLGFVDRRQVLDLVRDFAADHFPIRRFEETVFVRARIRREAVDQTDVRTFRRFDRTDATVVRRMHVAHFETGALARQATRSKRRNATLVRHFRQRVVLVHELRQLTRAEEFLDRGGHGLRVDHVLRHQAFAFCERQPFLHRTFDADQTDAELVLGHFADRTHAAVAEVVDVVDGAFAVADLDQRAQHVDDVLRVQHARADDLFATETTVELHATDCRQVVALRREEQVVEQILRRFLRRRLSRTHHPIDFDQRFQTVARRVDAQRVGDVRTAVEFVRVDRLDRRHAGFEQLVQHFVGDDRVARASGFRRCPD